MNLPNVGDFVEVWADANLIGSGPFIEMIGDQVHFTNTWSGDEGEQTDTTWTLEMSDDGEYLYQSDTDPTWWYGSYKWEDQK